MSNHKDHSRITEDWEFLCKGKDGTLFYAEQGFVDAMFHYSWPRDDLIGLLRMVGGSEYPSFHEAWRELMNQFANEAVRPQLVGGRGSKQKGVKVLGLRSHSDRE